ncbi:Fe-only nitrogenase subunit delta [Termitidicoccus mucosus]|uniref:Nitrogenase iron-iron protein delta chain n=1 Tax=Termitidicoccus mucosus TaxID=1184151 RepID=A0A178IQ37_9BACT|nr:nitrogenase iron-iron protein delta chain [Opitutaceae bacterium TSB47]
MDDLTKTRMDQLVDHIMKKCLWQFHSRAWDRKDQNAGILGKTTELLCGDKPKTDTPADRCYWVDAVCLAEAYKARFEWINTLARDEIRALMKAVHERMDFLTVTGSLNAELTDQHY